VQWLRCSDPNDLLPVCEFLRGVQVDARPGGDGTVSVFAPGATSALHERHEISGYVSTWNALNPGRYVELIEHPQPVA
jgi:hypothetical protein